MSVGPFYASFETIVNHSAIVHAGGCHSFPLFPIYECIKPTQPTLYQSTGDIDELVTNSGTQFPVPYCHAVTNDVAVLYVMEGPVNRASLPAMPAQQFFERDDRVTLVPAHSDFRSGDVVAVGYVLQLHCMH